MNVFTPVVCMDPCVSGELSFNKQTEGREERERFVQIKRGRRWTNTHVEVIWDLNQLNICTKYHTIGPYLGEMDFDS